MSTKGIKPRNEVPLSTLLHFTHKEQLETFLGGERVAKLKSAAVASGSKSLTKKDIIRAILTSEEASEAYSRSDMASTAYQKYVDTAKNGIWKKQPEAPTSQ